MWLIGTIVLLIVIGILLKWLWERGSKHRDAKSALQSSISLILQTNSMSAEAKVLAISRTIKPYE